MIKSKLNSRQVASTRAALRRRVKGFYQRFAEEAWDQCFRHLDPKLRTDEKTVSGVYVASLARFKKHYGEIQIWHVDISLHLEEKNNKRDDRPFAYVYVFWQDERKAFHVFRERWVLDSDRWYTRVAGLVSHTNGSATRM